MSNLTTKELDLVNAFKQGIPFVHKGNPQVEARFLAYFTEEHLTMRLVIVEYLFGAIAGKTDYVKLVEDWKEFLRNYRKKKIKKTGWVHVYKNLTPRKSNMMIFESKQKAMEHDWYKLEGVELEIGEVTWEE